MTLSLKTFQKSQKKKTNKNENIFIFWMGICHIRARKVCNIESSHFGMFGTWKKSTKMKFSLPIRIEIGWNLFPYLHLPPYKG